MSMFLCLNLFYLMKSSEFWTTGWCCRPDCCSDVTLWSVLYLTHNTLQLVWFCMDPVSERWIWMRRRQPSIQPSFIASRFMLRALLQRSHTWKGRRGHLIQSNVPLLTPAKLARHQGACGAQHLNNAIVPTDTDRGTPTYHKRQTKTDRSWFCHLGSPPQFQT